MTAISSSNARQLSFDVSTPGARARTLVVLRGKIAAFTEAEQSAYHAFRDALMRVGRGEGDTAELEAFKSTLGRFFETQAMPPLSALETASEQQAAASPSSEGGEQKIVVSTSSIPRARRGPDIRVQMPVVEAEGARESVAPPPSEKIPTPQPSLDIEEIAALRTRTEQINDELNDFAHGTAFKWLADQKTGYRDYLTTLLELRGAFVLEHAGGNIEEVKARVDELERQAALVRTRVGHAGGQDTPVDGMITSSAETRVVPPLPESAVSESDSVQSDVVQSVVADSPVEPISSTSVGEEAPVASGPEITISTPPPPIAIPVEQAVGLMEEEGVREQQEPEVTVPEPTPPDVPVAEEVNVSHSDEALLNPVNERSIEAGLNDLLTRWLGSTGFFGFGESGVKHPDWLRMKDLFVEDVLHGDGTIPAELRPEIYDNLGQNIRAWRDTYSLSPRQNERVEEYVRRVVAESIPAS